MNPVPENVEVLKPEGNLQDVALLEIQMNRSIAVVPSFAEDDTLFIPKLVPCMDSEYDPEAGISTVLKDTFATTLLLPKLFNVEVATTSQKLAKRGAEFRAGCSHLADIWESDSQIVAEAELLEDEIIGLMLCTPKDNP